ncbi:sugar transferase [Devosia sp. A8/3-2]|nr:sugar transferase [Devosia sp. A8/3-2]
MSCPSCSTCSRASSPSWAPARTRSVPRPTTSSITRPSRAISARHRVKPGMTGWAQVNGWRGETDTIDKIMQRVNHDLYYIEHWSILFDLYIVLLTPVSLVSKNENAY